VKMSLAIVAALLIALATSVGLTQEAAQQLEPDAPWHWWLPDRTHVSPANAAAPGEPGYTIVWERDGSEMVYVPAGYYVQGKVGWKDGMRNKNESPAHRVCILGFYLDKCEVSNKQFCEFLNDAGARAFWGTRFWTELGPDRKLPGTRYRRKSVQLAAQNRRPELDCCRYPDIEWTGSHWRPKWGRADYPVRGVTWHEAAAYAYWAGKRLPMEAEWEWAARGPEARVYTWGDEWDPAKACSGENAGLSGATDKVGSHPEGASWCGALNMAGNVAEWCQDKYSDWYYGCYQYVNPGLRMPWQRPGDPEWGPNKCRVIRGGSYFTNGYFCRAVVREGRTPDSRALSNGFRCVSYRWNPNVARPRKLK